MTPDISNGIPISDGKNDVTESDCETRDTTIPQAIKKEPSPIVILGID